MTEEPVTPSTPLWVFGYGSLMWNPGFPVAERQLATLKGYARSFCMSSIHHRGTVEKPGLVLALDPQDDAQCRGLGFRVPDEHATATVTYLRERELISSAYVERHLALDLDNGQKVTALVYVVDTAHEQYVAHLQLEAQAHIIANAVGGRGPNTEYLWNTVTHLEELGIADDDLVWLAKRVRALTSRHT
jgi:glutathione-specific gamma-glutamylcyclotransferase